MNNPVVVDVSSPAVNHAILHSPDGLLWADRVDIDTKKQVASLYSGDTLLGTITWAQPIQDGEILRISVNAGFRIRFD
jgi:hypothetical protein